MANLNIVYSDLTDVATLLDSGRTAMTELLTALKARVTELTGAGFRTDLASGQFATSYGDLNTGMTQAIGGLEGMAEFLRAAATTYADVDTQLAAGIRG